MGDVELPALGGAEPDASYISTLLLSYPFSAISYSILLYSSSTSLLFSPSASVSISTLASASYRFSDMRSMENSISSLIF